jgi:fructokinase
LPRRAGERACDYRALGDVAVKVAAGSHSAHAIIADYIAQACHMLFATVAVAEIVIGGVANTPGLVERVATRARELDAGYLPGGARHRIIRPRHGENAGIIGAMMLAEKA